METQNQKIDVITVCSADGSFRPLRFRYEDGGHQLHCVRVDQVLCCKPIEYVGIEAFVYTCRSYGDDGEHMYELKYTVRSHTWVLFRVLY